jgi:hypothetical protein
MIELSVNKDIIKKADDRLNLITTKDNRLSKFGSERKRIYEGYIGEEIIKNYLNINHVTDDYNYDLISNKGKKLEIKTVSCSFKPRLDYLCTVNSHSLDQIHKQNADYYIFIRLLKDYTKAWLLGWIECAKFFKIGTFVSKGKDFGKFKFVKANATVLEINQLNQFNG